MVMFDDTNTASQTHKYKDMCTHSMCKNQCLCVCKTVCVYVQNVVASLVALQRLSVRIEMLLVFVTNKIVRQEMILINL